MANVIRDCTGRNDVENEDYIRGVKDTIEALQRFVGIWFENLGTKYYLDREAFRYACDTLEEHMRRMK